MLVLQAPRKLKAYLPSFTSLKICYWLHWDLGPPEVSIFDFWETTTSPSAFTSQAYTTEVTNTPSPEVSQSWLNWLGGNKTWLKYNPPPSGNSSSLPLGSLTTELLKETQTSLFFFAFNLISPSSDHCNRIKNSKQESLLNRCMRRLWKKKSDKY